MLFFIMVDIEALYQVFIYKPIAFNTTPHFARSTLFTIAILSVLVTGVLIVLSFLAYTPLKTDREYSTLFFYVLYVKGVCLSPFIALEFFDLMFENIYLDVQF